MNSKNNMSSTHDGLPPLLPNNVSGAELCANIHVYLAVWDDLPPMQQRIVSQHVQSCPECERELLLMKRSTHLVACLDTSEPSARVDQAVMAAIASRRHTMKETKPVSLSARRQSASARRMPRVAAFSGIAAAALLAAFLSAYFVMGWGGHPQQAVKPNQPMAPTQTAFALPANLSWNNYVLYYKQSMTSAQGDQYQVTNYHNMSDDSIHTEMVSGSKLDVVIVEGSQKSLVLDKMHRVAQWNVHTWDVDDSMFDLPTLRKDLQSGRATYLGKATFNGQEVYRIRDAQGDVLLLNMQYMPVNALVKGQETATSKPMFDQLQWLSPNQVADSTWDMKVPANFKLGKVSPQL
jgi:hypothetical protein